MHNILFIAFQYQPINIGGVHRANAMAVHLKKFNINPIVVTLSYNSIASYYKLEKIEEKNNNAFTDIITYRIDGDKVKKSKIAKYLSIRDSDTEAWEEAVFNQLKDIVLLHNIKGILATAPPFTMASFAKRISVLFKLPFFLDMRDAWTYWNVMPYKTWLHYYFTKREEMLCFKQATKIFVTSQQTLNDFKLLHPSINKHKFQLVMNGYEDLLNNYFTQLDTNKQKIIIGYSGGFYYTPQAREQMMKPWWKKKVHRWLQYTPRKEDWLYRSPFFYFQYLHHLKNTNNSLFNKIETHFIGVKPVWFDDMVEQFNLQESIKHLGLKTHQESLNFQLDCDALLLTSSKVIDGRDYSIAGKTFEYISMLKPVLAFVTEGAQMDVMRQSGIAVMCNPDNIEVTATQLENFFNGNLQLKPNMNFINQVSRYQQIKIMGNTIAQSLQ